jgi:hypothetical protein
MYKNINCMNVMPMPKKQGSKLCKLPFKKKSCMFPYGS